MPLRFLVLVARSDAGCTILTERLQHRLPLPHRIDASGMTVFTTSPDDVVTLSDQGGLLVGRVFARTRPYPVLTALSDTDSRMLRHGRGETLGSLVWGGYLAFLRTEDDRATVVFREPTAALPNVYVETRDAVVFASDVQLLMDAGLVSPHVDDAALARHLALSDLKSTRTCLAGVCELLAGFRMTVSEAEVATEPIWSPWTFANNDSPSDFSELSETLREIVSDTVAAWARPFRHILLGASGGLDSSIIAAILAALPTPLTCLNMTTDEGEGDERRYARLLAAHLSVDLREAHHVLADVDVSTSISSHLPRPASFAFGQSERRTKKALIDALGIDALFTGIGGDNVFCSLQSATPLVDYIRSHGLGRLSWAIVNDVCDLTGASVWQVLGAAWSRSRRPTAYPWSHNSQFLTPHAVAAGAFDLSHPWLVPPDGALPGKASHIAMLLRITGTIDGFPRDRFPVQINPLISQPIIEACLAIPSWQWIAGGRNRSVAREAFARSLPHALVARQSKGGPDSFAYEVMETNKRQVRELLLGGFLAERDLIDRQAVEEALREDRPVKPLEHIRLAILAEAEVWARHWSGARSQDGTDLLRLHAADWN